MRFRVIFVNHKSGHFARNLTSAGWSCIQAISIKSAEDCEVSLLAAFENEKSRLKPNSENPRIAEAWL